jgi:hypothetical protein
MLARIFKIILVQLVFEIAHSGRVRGSIVHGADPCAKCQVISQVLKGRLDNEGARNSIDLRNRLGDDGKRHGKVVSYKVSEARLSNLLDDLCETLDTAKHAYTLKGNEWTTIRKADETAETKYHTRSLVHTCTDVLYKEEDRLGESLRNAEESGPSVEDIERILCHESCGHAKSTEL